MKRRHAVALALVTWYLFLPPSYPDHSVDTGAPLSRWFKPKLEFVSRSQCLKVKQTLVGLHVKPYTSEHEREKAQGEMAAICVSSDDPRLKGD